MRNVKRLLMIAALGIAVVLGSGGAHALTQSAVDGATACNPASCGGGG